MGNLYASDLVLAVNLEAFRAAANVAERTFKMLEEEERRMLNTGKAGREKDSLLRLMRTADGLANSAGARAEEANQLIGATYINRWAAFRRLIRWIRKRALPREYQKQLEAHRGKVRANSIQSNGGPAD